LFISTFLYSAYKQADPADVNRSRLRRRGIEQGWRWPLVPVLRVLVTGCWH
jgi:hypothetical protein